MKKQFKMEDYQVRESSGRCWGCCQENSECSHETYNWRTYYRIRKNGKIIKHGIYSKRDAQELIRTEFNPKWIQSQIKKEIRLLQKEIGQKRRKIEKLRLKLK